MTIKIYDRDSEFTAADVAAAQAKINQILPGINKSRMTTFGRFELPLELELSPEDQTTFSDWLGEHYPDWLAVFR